MNTRDSHFDCTIKINKQTNRSTRLYIHWAQGLEKHLCKIVATKKKNVKTTLSNAILNSNSNSDINNNTSNNNNNKIVIIMIKVLIKPRNTKPKDTNNKYC